MRLNRPTRKAREPDLTGLINIVFLILIFFIVAGALRPFSARDIKLAHVDPKSSDRIAPGRLIIHADGRMTYQGQALTREALSTTLEQDTALDRNAPFVIVADGRGDAAELLKAVSTTVNAGFKSVSVMAERRKAP